MKAFPFIQACYFLNFPVCFTGIAKNTSPRIALRLDLYSKDYPIV